MISVDEALERILSYVSVLEPEEKRILATPTLIRTMPGSERRVIGDLSDRDTVLTCLELLDYVGMAVEEEGSR